MWTSYLVLPPKEVVVQYITDHSCLAKADDHLLGTINLWLYSLVLKVVPCFVLTVFTGFLIKALYKAEERSARLKVCTYIQITRLHFCF